MTVVPIGVVHLEAEVSLLRTRLDVFVNPGDGSWLESSKILRKYAQEHWSSHVPGATAYEIGSGLDANVTQTIASSQIQLLELMSKFLNDDAIIRSWCQGIPWSFYTEITATMIVKSMVAWSKVADLNRAADL